MTGCTVSADMSDSPFIFPSAFFLGRTISTESAPRITAAIPASAGSLTNTAFQYLIVKAPFGVCLFLSVMTAFLHMALTSPGLCAIIYVNCDIRRDWQMF